MHRVFEKIGIIINQNVSQSALLAQTIRKKISNSEIFSIDAPPENIDLALVVGGDGTFLKASRFYSKFKTKILGFNVGRLGYLAQARPDEIDGVIEKLNSKSYIIENRIMLKALNQCALNDIVIKGENHTRTATLDLYINDKKLCSYVADGLIISTPTGSTAYSLSAGGPIISPFVECFLITAICPHTLNTRPIIIPAEEKITVKIREENQKLNVTFDGQLEILTNNEVEIQKNENCASLLILNQQKDRFYDILKEKLYWSLPPKK